MPESAIRTQTEAHGAALAEAGINIEMISTSEIRITCLVSRDQVGKGVRILHHAFELDQDLA